jgi:hypothetical protein
MTHFHFRHKQTNQEQSNSMQLKPSWEVNSYVTSQKISHILWNPRFIAVFTTAHHMSLFWATLIQSMSSYPLYFKSSLISSFHLLTGLPNSLIPSGFPTKILYSFFFSPICAPCTTHPTFVWYYHRTIWQGVQIMKLLRMQFSLASCYLFPLRST